MDLWEKMQKLQEACDDAGLGRVHLESVPFTRGDGEPNPDKPVQQGWRIVTLKRSYSRTRRYSAERWPKAKTQEEAITLCVNDMLRQYRTLCDALAPLEDIDF